MQNIVFLKHMPMTEVKAGTGCAYCGVAIAEGAAVAVYMVDDALKYVHPGESNAYLRYLAMGMISSDEESPVVEVVTEAKASTSLECPYCGISINPKDGVAFEDAENPNYSLGNHKRGCEKNPRNAESANAPLVVPASSVVVPMPPAPAPSAPAPSAPPLVASPAPAMPVEYSTSVWQQGENARVSFVNKPVPAHLYWNDRVTEEVWPIVRAAYADKQPVLFIGASGTGKTVFAHELARQYGAHHVGALNFSEDMRMDSLFGNPVPIGNGGIGWNDGIMTRAARWGGIALLEEFTRSGVAATRTMSALDQVERGLYLPENPFEQEVAVHGDMFVIATANPVGLGYTTKELDAAMRSRFVIIEANFPFADERKVIEPLIGADRADKLVDLFETLRLGGKFYPNTRDLVQIARLMFQKVPFEKAAKVALVSKCPNRHQEGVVMVVEQYKI